MFKNVDADVIIIGAGLSGLTAAQQLLEKEPCLKVIILESSKRIGGRVFQIPLSVRDGSSLMFFNIGGSCLSREQTHLLELIEKLDIPIVNSQSNSGKIIVEYDDVIHLLDSKSNMFSFLTLSEKIQLTKFILNLGESSFQVGILCHNFRKKNERNWIDELKNTTLETFIRKTITSEGLLGIINSMIFLYCGVATSQVSALFYIFFCISTKGIVNQLLNETKNLYEFRMKASASDICDKLVDEIGHEFILTDQRVSNISCTEKFVEVITDDYSYCCYDVIIAVSPEDISHIEFNPDLSEENYQSLNSMLSNPVTTFLATYPKEFWHEKDLSGNIYVFDRFHRRGPIDFCWNISKFDTPVLHGRIFSGGTHSNIKTVLKERILEELSDFLGKAALHPTDYCEKTWYGNSSQMFCGQAGAIINNSFDEKHIYDRIYWAGAENSTEWCGQLAGAVHSGIRAALEVLYDLRPSVLTSDDLSFLRPTQRSLKKSPREYESPIYSILGYAANWKTYLPLSLLVLFVLWRIKSLISN